MFPVPGWSVSAERLVSTQPNALSSASSTAEPAPSDSRSKSRKRRRDEPGVLSESRVTSEDLHRLWKKEFGTTSEVKQKSSKARKKQKRQSHPDANSKHENQAMVEVHDGTGSNVHDRDSSGFKGGLKRHKELKSEKKSKGKPREILISDKSASKAPEKLDTSERANLVQHSEIDKVEGHSQSMQHDTKVQKARKLAEMASPTVAKLTPLQAKMRDKLTSARFRHLNETLYTSTSFASLELFTASPDLFAEYHAGFAQQVRESWPQNPVQGYIRDINARAKFDSSSHKQDSAIEVLPLPRRKTGSCTIADLGCGDAPLARAFQSSSRALNLKFHNFDLHTPHSLVTKADIANLPLRDGEADIAVFCLSLMGTNWISFIEEAWRVLRGDGKGELWVAEVKSRFGRATSGKVVENSVGKKRKPQKLKANQEKRASLAEDETEGFIEDEDSAAKDKTDISAFRDIVQRRGFALRLESLDKHNKMFVSMIFNKTGIPAAGKHQGSKWNGREYEISTGLANGRKKFIDQSNEDDGNPPPEEEAKVLKPCVYKKR